MKICIQCGGRHSAKGLCKKCYNAQYSEKHRDEINKYHRERYEREAEKIKAQKTEWRLANREEYLKRRRKYQKENSVMLAEKCKEYRIANPVIVAQGKTRYRSRKKENGIFIRTEKDRIRQLARQRYCCFYCNIKMSIIHEEHVIPISRGGRDSVGNIVYACPACNHSKNNKYIVEWKYK